MIRVYVAHPIGPRDTARPWRVATAAAAGRELLQLGYAPFVPGLWATFDDDLISYERWIAYGLEWLQHCHAVLRIPGPSPGADREVARAHQLGLPVFGEIQSLIAWRRP